MSTLVVVAAASEPESEFSPEIQRPHAWGILDRTSVLCGKK